MGKPDIDLRIVATSAGWFGYTTAAGLTVNLRLSMKTIISAKTESMNTLLTSSTSPGILSVTREISSETKAGQITLQAGLRGGEKRKRRQEEGR